MGIFQFIIFFGHIQYYYKKKAFCKCGKGKHTSKCTEFATKLHDSCQGDYSKIKILKILLNSFEKQKNSEFNSFEKQQNWATVHRLGQESGFSCFLFTV